MQKRIVEKTGEWVSLLGFGCMRFPKKDGVNDMEQVQKMVDYAKVSGVNYFDTAYVYDNGDSERCIGKALSKYPRDSYFLATKLPIWAVKEESDIERILNTSLERLGTGYIDFYLLHSMDKDHWNDAKKFNAIKILKKYREEGKIKYIGFSFHDSPEMFREIVGAFDWDFVQIQLNYLDWNLQRAGEMYQIIEEKNLSCIVMEPIRGGALANPPKEVSDIINKAAVGVSPSSMALRFCASHPRVKVILSGMSSFENVKENVETLANFTPLTEEENKALDEAAMFLMSQPNIKCTDCHYCMPCPKGVNIPSSFTAYNDYMKFHNDEMLKGRYNFELKDASPYQCVKCGICVKKCPQHIDIPNNLDKVREVLSHAGI